MQRGAPPYRFSSCNQYVCGNMFILVLAIMYFRTQNLETKEGKERRLIYAKNIKVD